MDYFYNFESIDIYPFIKEYEGKRIEDLFQNHQIVTNNMGEFMEIIWKESTLPNDLSLEKSRKNLLHNLKTVYYIGDKIERKLMRRGVKSLYDLKINLRYMSSANTILKLIKTKDYNLLCENRYINDLDVAFCFNLEELLFIDIETMGSYNSPIIIIGLGYYRKENFEIHILFARNFTEEISICEHLKNVILPHFKCFVSYNGKSFDIPYISNRFLYYFDENPMITEEDIPYENYNTKFHHIDLYHNCRRKFKEEFEGFTLTNMEEKMLNIKREIDIPGILVGLCYRKYLEDPLRNTGLIKKIIEHNYYDIYSMPLILQKLLEE
ncbi:MAG: ribonuclease H-like domain-containing protein [Promethearchaeota archaeon]